MLSPRLAIGLLVIGACSNKSNDEVREALDAGAEQVGLERSAQTLEEIRAASAPRPSSESRAHLADDYRSLGGSKWGNLTLRRETIDKLLPLEKQPPMTKDEGEVQLILVNGARGFRIRIGNRVWATADTIKPGKILTAHLLTYSYDDGVPKLKESVRWNDTLTLFRQAGVPGIDSGAMTEESWPDRPIEVIATGGEDEATRLAHVKSLHAGLADGDPDAVARDIAPGFVDRDVTMAVPTTHAEPSSFRDATAAELATYGLFRFRELETWAAGEWVVARVSRAYRLAEDLPGHPGSAKRSVLSYEAWLYRFKGDKIVARWRFSDGLNTNRQLGTVDMFDLMRRRRSVK